MSTRKTTLLDNANGFIEEALSKALVAERDPSQWKYAIIHLIQAIELLLKARLQKEHPVLIYANIDKPVHTVSLDAAILRLEKISGVSLTKSDRSAIATAYELRNQIIHFHFAYKDTEVKAAFSTLLGFVFSFGKRELNNELDLVVPDSLYQEAIKIREFADELYDRARSDMKSRGINTEDCSECHFCGYSLILAEEPGAVVCPVCGHVTEIMQCYDCHKPLFGKDMYEYETGDLLHSPRSEKCYPDIIRLCERCYDKRHRDDEAYWEYMRNKGQI